MAAWRVIAVVMLGLACIGSADSEVHAQHPSATHSQGHAHPAHAHEDGHHHGHTQQGPDQRLASDAPHHEHANHDHGHGHDHGHSSHGQRHEHHVHDHEHDHGHSSHGHSSPKKCAAGQEDTTASSAVAWQALLAVAAISCAPLFSVPLLPLLSTPGNLAVGMAFAAGSLIADVFLHLLPHEMMKKCASGHGHEHGEHGHSHDPADLWGETKEGVLLIAGFVLFMILARLTTALMGQAHEAHGSSTEAHGSSTEAHGSSTVGSGAVVLMLADASHNFTDGLAVGAAFLSSPARGMATATAVFFHELPHEVGDIAVLINQGLSTRRAVFTQFMTASGAVLGCVLGLVSGAMMTDAGTTIGLLSGGGFVYVATVTVAPQLLQGGLWQCCKELVALGAGVGMMVLILVLE